MSGVSRRQLLGAAAVVGVAGAIGARRLAGRRTVRPTLVVFDSRKSASAAFARAHQGIRAVDLAGGQGASWDAIRRAGRKGTVAGLTGWNDYVSARQWLEERGLRVRAEDHDRRHDLIAWTMA